MQTVASRSNKWLRGFFVAALYVSVFGCATPTTPAPKVSAPVPSAQAPAPAAIAPAPKTPPSAPVISQPPAPQPHLVTKALPAPAPLAAAVPPKVAAEHAEPHFALLLPLNSPAFGKAADAVKQGFLAAASRETNALPVRIYPCKDESTEIVALYQQALANGAIAVAGPLTRNGVAALAASNAQLTTPTLALNLIDDNRTDQLYFFGLPPEAEARQSAQRATAAGLLSATIISTDTPLSRRLAQAFSDEWQRAGGILQSE